MKPALLSVLAFAALAGCTTMTPEERRAADEEICRSYGFTKRNDAFAECLQRIELDRRAARRSNMAAMELNRPIVIYRPVPVRTN